MIRAGIRHKVSPLFPRHREKVRDKKGPVGTGLPGFTYALDLLPQELAYYFTIR